MVICTDLCGKELHKQVGMAIGVTSESLHDVMVAHWPRMPEMWVFDSRSRYNISHFHHSNDSTIHISQIHAQIGNLSLYSWVHFLTDGCDSCCWSVPRRRRVNRNQLVRMRTE